MMRERWADVKRLLVAVTVAVTLTGCRLPPAGPRRPPPIFGPEAYKTAEPRSEAFYTVCGQRGGHVLGQDCVIHSAGGQSIIRIFEDEAR